MPCNVKVRPIGLSGPHIDLTCTLLRLRIDICLPACSWLTWGYLGWRGVVAVYAFFWVAGLVQR